VDRGEQEPVQHPVANFSLHSSLKTNFFRDPLDRAVEKLWFSGVVSWRAAGNYGTGNSRAASLLARQRPVRDHRRRARPERHDCSATTTRLRRGRRTVGRWTAS
jgi:hypothetical protein